MILIDIVYRVCEGEDLVDAVEAFQSLADKVQKIVNCLTDAAFVVAEDIMYLLIIVEGFFESVDEIVDIGSGREKAGYFPGSDQIIPDLLNVILDIIPDHILGYTDQSVFDIESIYNRADAYALSVEECHNTSCAVLETAVNIVLSGNACPEVHEKLIDNILGSSGAAIIYADPPVNIRRDDRYLKMESDLFLVQRCYGVVIFSSVACDLVYLLLQQFQSFI